MNTFIGIMLGKKEIIKSKYKKFKYNKKQIFALIISITQIQICLPNLFFT